MRDKYLLIQNNINFLNLRLYKDMNTIHPKNHYTYIHPHTNSAITYMMLISTINMSMDLNILHHYNYFYLFM